MPIRVLCELCGADLGDVAVASACETSAPGGGGLLTLTVSRPAGLGRIDRHGAPAPYCAACAAEAAAVDVRALVRERVAAKSAEKAAHG